MPDLTFPSVGMSLWGNDGRAVYTITVPPACGCDCQCKSNLQMGATYSFEYVIGSSQPAKY